MLVCFRAENFWSILKPIELNLRPAQRLRNHKSHVLTPLENDPKLKVLKTCLIYGANASGKTNIVRAIDFVKRLITTPKKTDDKIDFVPFKVTKYPKEYSSFFIEYVFNNIHFALTIKVNKDMVLYERLSVITKSNESVVFERLLDKDSHEFRSDILDEDTSKLVSSISKYIPENSSLISFITQNDKAIKDLPNHFVEYLTGSFLYFEYCLVIVFPNYRYGGLTEDLIDGTINNYGKRIAEFDTGIESISIDKVELSLFPPKIISRISKDMEYAEGSIKFSHNSREFTASRNGDNIEIHEIILKHKDSFGNDFNFSISEESDGTVRLLDLLPALASSDELLKETSPTFVIDEFDRSLHPALSKMFIEKFLNNNTHTNQIIATTHQSELLDLNIIRRDSIWFVQKEWDQSSSLYSLNEYGTRHDKDIQKAYLNGMFGAIPIIKDKL